MSTFMLMDTLLAKLEVCIVKCYIHTCEHTEYLYHSDPPTDVYTCANKTLC